jgi:hypothetical protein
VTLADGKINVQEGKSYSGLLETKYLHNILKNLLPKAPANGK